MEQRLGPYEIIDKLGTGGMGAVYRARHVETGQSVALKVMREDLAEDEAYIKRFRREAAIAKSIESPHVVRVLDAGQEGYIPYIAMELVEGETLATLLRQRGPLPVEQAVDIVTQVAQGLHAAQARGVIHRDISPQNILITPDGTVKVTDFGVARSQSTATLTSTGAFVGKPTYAPPEMMDGTADTRSDIYSLGVVMFEMLTGRPPFMAPTPLATMDMHERTPPPRLGLLGVRVPGSVEDVMRMCLSKNANERFQTPEALINALRQASTLDMNETILSPVAPDATQLITAVAVQGGRGRTPPPASPPVAASRMPWRFVLVAGSIGIAAFLVAGAATWLLTRDGEPPTIIYVVQEGDTLENLATRFGITATQIAGLNGLTESAQLTPGQALVLPADVRTPAPSSDQPVTPTPPVVAPVVADPPTLLSPASAASIPQHVAGDCPGPDVQWAFTWRAPTNSQVTGYEIVIERPPDAPLVNTSTTSAAYTHVMPCSAVIADAGLTGWTWKVRAKSAAGEPGQWSEPRAFSVGSRANLGRLVVNDLHLTTNAECTLYLRAVPARGQRTDPCMPPGTTLSIANSDGPVANEGFIWWPVQVTSGDQFGKGGWVAEGDGKDAFVRAAGSGE